LPSVAAANIAALKADGDFAAGLERYTEIARILCRNPTAEASDGVHWLRAAANQLEIPSLDRWGLDPREVPALAEQAMQSSSMKGNPIKLGRQALEHAIYQALEMEH
jgi:hypothetical protein